MKNLFTRAVLGALFGLLFAITGLAAQPTVKRFTLNGLDVYLINTHTGNAAALTVNIQEGSYHDEPVRHAGRSHLFEHVFHYGSKKFPGPLAFDAQMKRVGGSYNAYTTHNRVFYHGYFHPDAFHDAAEVMGAAISELEWNWKSIQVEKQNVKDEAKRYQDTDAQALQSSVFINLLPKGHPLAMYEVGTAAQLDAMTLDDLKELYYSNYVPGSMSVIVAGNFDRLPDGTVPLTEEMVVREVSENFFPADIKKDPHGFRGVVPPLKNKVFPEMVPQGAKFLELGTKTDTRMLSLVFEVVGSDPKRPEVLETLLDYLNIHNDGGLHDLLKKKGWIAGGGFGPQSINNLTMVAASFALTEEGARNRSRVIETIFSYLHGLQENGLQREIVEYLKKRNVVSYSQLVENAEKAAEDFARALDFRAGDGGTFDFEARYGSVTSDEVRALILKAFDPARMIGGFLGPEVVSETVEPTFERPVKVLPPEAAASWARAMREGGATDPGLKIRLPEISIPFSRKPLAGEPSPARVLPPLLEGRKILLEEKHHSPTGAALVVLRLAPVSARSQLALDLFLDAFAERYKTETDYFASMGVSINLSTSGARVALGLEGNSRAVLHVGDWILDKLAGFTPTAEEIEQRRREALLDLEEEAQEPFPARLSNKTSRSLLAKGEYLDAEVRPVLEKIPLGTVLRLARHKLRRSDFDIVLTGDFDQTDALGLLNQTYEHFPRSLTAGQRTRTNANHYPIAGRHVFWKALTGSQSDKAIGVTRTFNGPEPFSREHAALAVLQKALGDAIFNLNRTIKGLGYIHSSRIEPTRTGVRISLFGQTEGVEKFPEISLGWNEIIGRIKTETLSEEKSAPFASDRMGLLRSESLIPSEQLETATEIHEAFRLTGDPNANQKLITMVREVTPEEIYAVGKRYLTSPEFLEVVLSKGSPDFLGCDTVLTKATTARRKIRTGK